MNKFLRGVLLFCFLILVIVLFAYAQNDLTCYLIQNTTCPAGTARLIGLENDTEGFNNAHAQNNSYNTYNYSICCNVTDNASITISSACPGNVTVLNLYNGTNSHVEIGTNSNYSISVCLGSDWKYVGCSFPTGTCPPAEICILSMVGSEGTNSSNAHVGNCSQYSQKVCCKLTNNAPTKPTLYYPVNGNASVIERKPNFNWSDETDPDGDSVDYTLWINCTGCGASCSNYTITDIASSNYTVTTALCVDEWYNWTVRACDTYDACNNSNSSNFTIASIADFELIVNITDFGSMANEENNDTTDDHPPPLVGRNIGNVILNVTINATSLFDSVAINTVYYQFAADENETDSYTAACSQTAFANMDTAEQRIFCELLYEDATDEGEIELNITVPTNEGAGSKNSLIYMSPYSTE